jgi:hypothetical protein
MHPQALVKGKKYRLRGGEEVVFEALMPDYPPVAAAVSSPNDRNDVWSVLLDDIVEEADQRWRGMIIP